MRKETCKGEGEGEDVRKQDEIEGGEDVRKQERERERGGCEETGERERKGGYDGEETDNEIKGLTELKIGTIWTNMVESTHESLHDESNACRES